MPKGYPPTIFVSSTCYYLDQVRADLKNFLTSLGTEPLLSETPAFPINPDAKTIENCVTAVKERADIFILIVGTQYGSIDDASGKSITNLEYLAAKAKGIPIYIFLLKSIVHTLPIWKKNPNGDYSNIVDNPKLFDFVEKLRDSKEHWVFTFEQAEHIIEALRQQLALLFMDALSARMKFKESSAFLESLSGKSLKFAIERPKAWEYRLFANVLAEAINDAKPLKWDLLHGLQLGPVITMEKDTETFGWMQTKLEKLIRLTSTPGKLINVLGFSEPKCKSDDPEQIIYTARRLGDVYKSLLEWAIDFNLVKADSKFDNLIRLGAKYSDDTVKKLEEFPKLLNEEIDRGLQANAEGKDYTGKLTIMFSLSNDELMEEVDRLGKLYQRR
jgi:uncharacterized protein DUF4062